MLSGREPLQTEPEKRLLYRVWGDDKTLYGPMELSGLIDWMKAHAASLHSWVFLEDRNVWKKATELPELNSVFSPIPSVPGAAAGPPAVTAKGGLGFTSTALRRIKLFDSLGEAELESFFHYLEAVNCPQFSHVVRRGQRGEAMYLVLEGELRALTIVEGKETTLTTMTAGDWFGELSLLDHGPRSVDVIANKDSVLLKLSSEAFERLLRGAPSLAVPFLRALTRTMVDRIRRATKRYEDSLRFIRVSGIVH